MFVQNFIELSAAVHELSCAQRKKTLGRKQAVRYRADSNNSNNYRSDQNSPTSAKNSAAAWRTQRTQYSCCIWPYLDSCTGTLDPDPESDHHKNLTVWSLVHSPRLHISLDLATYTAQCQPTPYLLVVDDLG